VFASVFSRFPARLRHALAYVKAFAFLEDPPRPGLASVVRVDTPALSAACAGDRRRGPGVVHGARPGPGATSCGTVRASAGRGGRPAAPTQRCATPTTSGKRADRLAGGSKDRRAAVAGGFLHR